MIIKAMIVEDDGITPILDSVTKEPHVMEFPFGSYVDKVVRVWSDGQKSPDGSPKFSNYGKIIQDKLYNMFTNEITPQVAHLVPQEEDPFIEEKAKIAEALAAIEAKKLSLFVPATPVEPVEPVEPAKPTH